MGHSVLGTGTILKENPSTDIRVLEPTFCFIGMHLSGRSTCQSSQRVPGVLLSRANCPAFSKIQLPLKHVFERENEAGAQRMKSFFFYLVPIELQINVI